MSRKAHCKGLLIEPAVRALASARARTEPELPDALKHYLDEEVLSSEWYPTEDLIGLLRVIGRVMMPSESDEQVFQYFGMVGAQRDLLGEQFLVGKPMQIENAGAFRGVIDSSQNLETILRRAFGMWLIYHDAGDFELRRTGEREMSVVQRDYPLVSEEMCFMTKGYYREVLRLAQTAGRIDKKSCRVRGDELCEWRLVFEDSVDVSSLSAFE